MLCVLILFACMRAHNVHLCLGDIYIREQHILRIHIPFFGLFRRRPRDGDGGRVHHAARSEYVCTRFRHIDTLHTHTTLYTRCVRTYNLNC